MKYKVTTAYLICGGDISHKDEWVFDTREEAQQFVDTFHKAFPKFDMDDPYICSSPSTPEIEEIKDLRADPYTWLWEKITEKEEREKRIKERQRR